VTGDDAVYSCAAGYALVRSDLGMVQGPPDVYTRSCLTSGQVDLTALVDVGRRRMGN
jgi:hypothetical protein